ncbi:magnesium transport protein CorA [Bacteroidales bacterium]|nr:magnesium transport protein CorA [Bacteroidales bacterium]
MASKTKNRHLLSEVHYTGENDVETNLCLIKYDAHSFCEQQSKNAQEVLNHLDSDKINWVRVAGMSEPNMIVDFIQKMGLNSIDAKDVVTIQHIVTIEEYDKNIFIVLPALYFNEDKVLTAEHISFILGENYVFSFKETSYPLFKKVYELIKGDLLKIKTKKADFLLACLLSEVIHNFSDVVSHLEDNLDSLEDLLLDTSKVSDNLIGRIQENRRMMIRVRKLILPFKDQFAKLLRVDKNLIGESECPFYKDLSDQLLYVLQSLESCREIMTSLIDLYINNNDVRMNAIMQRLTVVATIFIPLTFLAGVWGMNFEGMPELEIPYAYYFAWGLFVVIGFLLSWYLKRKKWI